MAHVFFTPNLARHVSCPSVEMPGTTVREVLDGVFAGNPLLRSYIVDDQAALRRHMTVFVDGEHVRDRLSLSDPVQPKSQIHVVQALSGG